MNTRRRQIDGFTMAELLVVVAIVGVLVAIAIPVFTSQLEAAKAATCESNRNSVKHVMIASYLSNPSEWNAADALKEAINQVGENLCPDGGVYSVVGTSPETGIEVVCSKHKQSEDTSNQFYDSIIGLLGADTSYKDIKDKNNLTGVSDTVIRAFYAKENGISSWTPVVGKNGNGVETTYYLQFKSYNNNTSGLFLYASSNSDPNTNDWKAKYICDSTGLLGDASKGQWYELNSTVNQWGTETLQGLKNGADEIKKLLESGTKVNLVNGQFVEA